MGSFGERGSCPLFAMDFRSASAKEKRINVGFVVSFILVPCDIVSWFVPAFERTSYNSVSYHVNNVRSI